MTAALNQQPSARQLWQGFHWTFFIDVQGLILSLLRFEQALLQSDFSAADIELRCAAMLLRASGAAMQLAGSFSPLQYRDDVRVSMMQPNVRSDDFSGLMSWDHARLIRLWQQLSPRLGKLPDALNDAHREFVTAFIEMMGAHRSVCARFVGEDSSSLRSCAPAVDILEKILGGRLRMIDPGQLHSGGCPFAAARRQQHDEEQIPS